ncbi:MAG: DNA glycosylase AlkZ-like family protein [Anaerolineae bacterium]
MSKGRGYFVPSRPGPHPRLVAFAERLRSFDALASQLVELGLAGGPLGFRCHQEEWVADELAEDLNVRRLPRFDTYLLGYRDRTLVIPHEFAKRVHPGGGILHLVVLVKRLAAGTCKIEHKGVRLERIVEPFGSLEDKATARLEDQVRRLARSLKTDGHLKLLSR